jgi:hypothetical protein
LQYSQWLAWPLNLIMLGLAEDRPASRQQLLLSFALITACGEYKQKQLFLFTSTRRRG